MAKTLQFSALIQAYLQPSGKLCNSAPSLDEIVIHIANISRTATRRFYEPQLLRRFLIWFRAWGVSAFRFNACALLVANVRVDLSWMLHDFSLDLWFYNKGLYNRAAQNFWGLMPQTPNWNLAQNVKVYQVSSRSEVSGGRLQGSADVVKQPPMDGLETWYTLTFWAKFQFGVWGMRPQKFWAALLYIKLKEISWGFQGAL